LPESRVLDRPGWKQIVTPTFKTGGFNDIEIVALSEASRERTLDAGLEEYTREGILFRIYVLPGPDAQHVSESLKRRGLEMSRIRCMVRDTSAVVLAKADPSLPPLRVERVTRETVSIFSDAMARGWNVTRGPLDQCNELALETTPPTGLYIAYVGDTPAGVAMSGVHGRSVYLFGTVVLPEFRGRGIYKALVARRIDDAARGSNVTLVTSQARDHTSAPILERVGFRSVCTIDVFHG